MIDDIGYRILKILQRKARIPNVEVARQVNMAPSAVLERIRKLESQGYIDGYEVRLNPHRFTGRWWRLCLSKQGIPPAEPLWRKPSPGFRPSRKSILSPVRIGFWSNYAWPGLKN